MDSGELWRFYVAQDFLTPGAAETVGHIIASLRPGASARVLELAFGNGEGACRVAAATGCRAVGVDAHPMTAAAIARARDRGVGERVGFVRGDGGTPPVRDGAFDGAWCIGGPSIIGTERCLAAMHRAVRSGGWILVSDWVWRAVPVPADAVPRGVEVTPLTVDDYAGLMRAAGFVDIEGRALPQSAWDAYYAPIRPAVASLSPEDAEHDRIAEELRVYDAAGRDWWRYAVFTARRP
jgi:SAM-dependent methyltransferase